MKTLSDVLQEDAARAAGVQLDEQRDRLEWLARVEGLEIKLCPGELHANRHHLRAGIRSGWIKERLGVACDECGTELVNRRPGVVDELHPPHIYIGCAGCGWIGTMPQSSVPR